MKRLFTAEEFRCLGLREVCDGNACHVRNHVSDGILVNCYDIQGLLVMPSLLELFALGCKSLLLVSQARRLFKCLGRCRLILLCRDICKLLVNLS